MEDKYNLEITKEEKQILDCAIWLYYHTTMEQMEKMQDKWARKQMIKDMEICKSLINRIKELNN